MPKYLNRPPLTKHAEAEIFPLLDRALELPFNKAIIYPCPLTRAEYLYKIISGERYRNAIESVSTYREDDPLYAKGLYYHIIVDTHPKGLIIAHVQNPPGGLTWDIVNCLATRKPVKFTSKVVTAQSRLKKLQERFPELNPIYVDTITESFLYAIPDPEELLVVDIDVSNDRLSAPTEEQKAKARR